MVVQGIFIVKGCNFIKERKKRKRKEEEQFKKYKLFEYNIGRSKEEVYYLILKVYVIEYRFVNNLFIREKEGVNVIGFITYNQNNQQFY